MFVGGTRATVTQKGFRERRSFEAILADQFVGKLGEIIELDWDISTRIEKFKNDITNAKKKVSIKTSPSLAGIWAEADIGLKFVGFRNCLTLLTQKFLLQMSDSEIIFKK